MRIYLIGILMLSRSILLAQSIPIIPEPSYITIKEGNLLLNNEIEIINNFEDESLNPILTNFNSYLTDSYQVYQERKYTNTVKLIISKDLTIENKEGYELDISEDKIQISANEVEGVFYALQSLKQIIYFSENMNLPYLTIKDEPLFKWRGLVLDVSRHFFTVDEVKRLLDLMAFYKLNIFHWHLTDNEGWRIEIKKYPELTEIGAKGDISNKDKVMFYSQEEILDVIKYAQERGIEIIPEIESPGHSRAASEAYPFLKCEHEERGVVYCAGKETTYEFLENVLAEVIELFPSEYVHIGGDEAWKAPWQRCSYCQRKMEIEELEDVEELQSYFVKRMEEILSTRGKKLIGWEEIREGGLAESATVQSWQGINAAIESANKGHNVIVSSKYAFYFGKAQSENRYTEPPAWRQAVTLKNTYDEEIIHEAIPRNLRKYIIGGEGALWAECLVSEERLQYQMFPRGIALAENLWSSYSNRNYEVFTRKLVHHLDYLKEKNINYRFPATVNIIPINNVVYLEAELPFAEIRYTIDGSDPDMNSPIYNSPFFVQTPINLKASIVWENRCLRPDARIIADFIHRTSLKVVSCTSENSQHSAKNCIDPGIGSFDYPGKFYPTWNFWLSNKQDSLPIEIVIDLGDLKNVSGFEYKPRNDGTWKRETEGNILEYEIYFGETDKKVSQSIYKGSFSGESKVELVRFETIRCRYLKIRIIKGVAKRANIADIRFFR